MRFLLPAGHRKLLTCLYACAILASLLFVVGCASTCAECGQGICLPDTCLQNADRPVMIDFCSPDCPGCQEIESTINTLAVEYEGQAIVRKVNVYRYPAIAEAHHVRKLPTVVLYIHGREAMRWIEPRPARVYRTAIEKALRMMDIPERDPSQSGLDEWGVRTVPGCSDGACTYHPAD
jgi:thiol-disulfide isomerase/thioredoxin